MGPVPCWRTGIRISFFTLFSQTIICSCLVRVCIDSTESGRCSVWKYDKCGSVCEALDTFSLRSELEPDPAGSGMDVLDDSVQNIALPCDCELMNTICVSIYNRAM